MVSLLEKFFNPIRDDNADFHGVETTLNRLSGLVNVYIAMERSTILMGKSTISMAMFNSCVKLPEGSSFRLYGTDQF